MDELIEWLNQEIKSTREWIDYLVGEGKHQDVVGYQAMHAQLMDVLAKATEIKGRDGG